MNILYATDGSDCAASAGRLLATLPLPADTHVTVLSVVSGYEWLDAPLFAEWSFEEGKIAHAYAEAAAAPFRKRGLSVTASVRRGNAAAAILDQAEEDHASLIVVGSYGKGAIQRFVLGSVSERVARYAHTSVLVVRGTKLERAIVAVDSLGSSDQALEALPRLPLPTNLALTVVHVLPTNGLSPPVSLTPSQEYELMVEQYETQRRTVAEQVVGLAEQRLREAGRPAEVQIRCGDPAEQIIEAAGEMDADLVVAGAANRSVLGRLFLGRVSGRVLTHAPCSVLIARSEEPRT